MKKAFIIILCVLFIPVLSLAESIDLSGLSFDELIALKNRINLAMWESEKWQEVTVPPGTWKIGEDIPAGHWTIRPGISHGYFHVWYFEKPNEFNKPIAPLSKYDNSSLATEDFHPFDEEYNHEVDFDMIEGWYFYNEKTVIFTPYTGKPDLGFKK